MSFQQSRHFLRIPPFPGAHSLSLAMSQRGETQLMSDSEVDRLLNEIRDMKIGGDFWAAQPPLPPTPYTLVRISDSKEREGAIKELGRGRPIVVWIEANEQETPFDVEVHTVRGACDPWHLVGGADEVIMQADDELALIAGIAGIRRRRSFDDDRSSPRHMFQGQVIDNLSYVNPFTKEPMAVAEAIRLCGFWRRMIDGNRDIGSAVGFAYWKRPTVAPLLWNGSDQLPFVSRPGKVDRSRAVAVWKSRTRPAVLAELERSGARLFDVEDGFIRSAGLGADCVPPLSIVVDRLGAHFDPHRPSELEQLIESGPFPDELVERARRLRDIIVSLGVGKYGAGTTPLKRRPADRLHVLVAGQVEDDRAVLCGRGEVSGNLDLLKRAREQVPEAYILYKPHPDVEAGHRAGRLADDECLEFANEIVRDGPISAVLDIVDEVHVISSLAGFEALVRGKRVVAHGAPFYAGWGLTRDLGPIPSRRTARRTLDELIAAVLLLYPRYLDPVTGLPCPPEILVRRIAEGSGTQRQGIVVQLRRLQGRWKKKLARVGLG